MSSICTTTIGHLISRALRMLGVKEAGEPLGSEESKDALQVANFMLAQWSLEKLTVYKVVNELFDIVPGQSEYTIGPSPDANWNTDRPIIFEKSSMFIRETVSGVNSDTPLEYYTNDQFQQINQKSTQSSIPVFWSWDRNFPLATIKMYPVPSSALKIGLSQTMQFDKFNSVSDAVGLPPGYDAAIAYNLAVELSPEYGVSSGVLQTIAAKAEETKANLKRVNKEMLIIDLDRDLVPSGRYNIVTNR